MTLAMFHSWWTVALVILFLAIVVWAWSGKRKQTFERAARMPLEDDDVAQKHSTGGNRHG
jgi:cytochrome c oxidase cbb3-type subunit 4